MSQKTDLQLTAQAEEIRDETVTNANTATRVGTMLVDMIDSKTNNQNEASETVKGILEIATQAETDTGTDDVRALTPLKAATRYAPLASPALTGTPTVPTAAQGTNTTQVATTAFVRSEIIGVQDLPISATAMWPRVTSGCSVLTQYEMTTSLFNIQGLEFSDTVQQFCQCQTALPRKWNNGTVTAIIYWKPLASGSGDVRWGVQMGAYSNDDALTVALGAEVAVTDTFIATDDLHITSATAAITAAGSPADADFLAIQINRDPTNGSDTLDVNAILLGITIRLTTDAAIDA